MPLPSTGNVSRPQALGYQALLDDLYLRLVGNAELQTNPSIETLRPEATRIDTGQNPEDFISEVGQTFSRTQFAGGEGLGFAHREGSAKNRYWDSARVDVSLPDPGNRHSARLLRKTDKLISSTYTSQAMVAERGGSLWLADHDILQRTDDPLAASPTFSTEDPGGTNNSDIEGLAMLGAEVYAGLGIDGIRKRPADGSSWEAWSDVDASLLWAVKRRIIARGGGNNSEDELYEARSGAGSVLLATLAAGNTWQAAADGGSHVLVGADDGVVYAFSAEEGADMALVAQSQIPNESISSLAALGGVVLIGTYINSKSGGAFGRLWRGDLASDGTLANLDLVRQWGDENTEVDNRPSVMTIGRRSAFIGMIEQTSSTTSGMFLWRYDLSTGGVSRHLEGPDGFNVGTFFNVYDVDELSGVLFLTVENDGLHRQSLDSYESSGYLMTPAADFFTALEKSWQEITVDVDLPSGDDGSDTSVEAFYATDLDAMDDPDSNLWTSAGTVTPGSADTFQITGVQSRFLVLKVELSSSTDNTATPKVNSISVTATVVAEELSITLPVNVSDVIELPGRKRKNLYGLGEKVYQQLRAKHGKEATLTLFRPSEKIRGVVWSVSAPVPSVSSRGERTVICNVEVRGKPTS